MRRPDCQKASLVNARDTEGFFMASVTLEHVAKTYASKLGEVRALDDVSLAVSDREFAVLVGPSGCGKTSTLRVVAGLEEVTTGTIRIGDRVVTDVAPKDRDIAMVFQNYALYPHMTVFKNMAFGLKMRRVPKAQIKHRVHEVADMLGVSHLLDRKPAALSGGEKQRVAVGRAIARRPRVFLFDEPLSNLDAKLRMHMRTELKDLHRKLQTTIIYVTHDQEEAMTLGDRLIIMRAGRIQQCGAPLDVYDRPSNRFVAGFIGTPPMNLLEGRIEHDGSGAFFTGKAVRLAFPENLTGAMKALAGQEVVLGVRPEHMRFDGAGAQSDDPKQMEQTTGGVPQVRASVTVVEPLGDRITVHLVTRAGEPIVANVSPTVRVSPGQDITIAVDMTRAHLYASDDTGGRLH